MQCTRRAACRAAWIAGSSMAMSNGASSVDRLARTRPVIAIPWPVSRGPAGSRSLREIRLSPMTPQTIAGIPVKIISPHDRTPSTRLATASPLVFVGPAAGAVPGSGGRPSRGGPATSTGTRPATLDIGTHASRPCFQSMSPGKMFAAASCLIARP